MFRLTKLIETLGYADNDELDWDTAIRFYVEGEEDDSDYN